MGKQSFMDKSLFSSAMMRVFFITFGKFVPIRGSIFYL
jgi:hypothetical protein